MHGNIESKSTLASSLYDLQVTVIRLTPHPDQIKETSEKIYSVFDLGLSRDARKPQAAPGVRGHPTSYFSSLQPPLHPRRPEIR